MRAEFNQFLRLATAKKFDKFVETSKELNALTLDEFVVQEKNF